MKKVLMPIEVPDGDYCWEYTGFQEICDHFDNEGGHPTCDLNLGHLDYKDTHGVLKCSKCKQFAHVSTESN